jgi:hypothetical protein
MARMGARSRVSGGRTDGDVGAKVGNVARCARKKVASSDPGLVDNGDSE